MSNIESFLRHYLVFEEVESKFRVFFDDSSNLLDKKTGRNSASYSHIDWNWRKGIAILSVCISFLFLSFYLKSGIVCMFLKSSALNRLGLVRELVTL